MSLRVAFIQEEERTQHGIMYLSAVLKQHNFDTSVFIIETEKEAIFDKIAQYNPAIVGATVTTPSFKKMMQLFDSLKKKHPEYFLIMGGAHPTFYPEIIYSEPSLDAVCRGEGEHALLSLAKAISNGSIDTSIKNLWIKHNGQVHQNEIRDLIEDIDSLPFPDREIYFTRYPFLATRDIKINIARGCPFNCSYCFNKGMRDLYKGKGQWVRLRSIDKIMEEIKTIRAKYPIKWINIHDDTFNINKEWVKDFLRIYKQEIDIPFLCQLRIDRTDEEQIDLLKKAGVDRITVGIEHGDESFRKKVLNRNMSNEHILAFGDWVAKRKIRLHTNNIVGFPGETLDMAFSTVMLNVRLKPELALLHVLNPYPGTDIYTYAKDNGYLNPNFDFNDLTGQNLWAVGSSEVGSYIKNENIPLMMNLRCFIMILIFYPFLKPLVEKLIRLPNNPAYEFLWKITSYFRIEWKYADWKGRRKLLRRLFF